MDTEGRKGLLEYTEDDLRQGLRPGDYHLRISEATGSSWDEDGQQPRLDIKTQVVSGEHADQFGPNNTWSTSEFIFEGSEETEPFTITQEEQAKKIRRQVIDAIHGGRELQLSNDNSWDVDMMKEIARQLVGDEFIAKVYEDKNGYSKLGRIYSIDKPPKGFRVPTTHSGFSL